MSIAVDTTEGPIEFSDALICAVARRADFVAALTAQAIGIALKLPELPQGQVYELNVPAGFLLELGAVLVIEMWERRGFTAHIIAGLPSWREADNELVRLLREDPTHFDQNQHGSLNRRVLQFWLENFAWDGIETFGADILVTAGDEDAIVDAVADFIWKNRREFEAMLQQRGQRS
jgi:hypothetical protein